MHVCMPTNQHVQRWVMPWWLGQVGGIPLLPCEVWGVDASYRSWAGMNKDCISQPRIPKMCVKRICDYMDMCIHIANGKIFVPDSRGVPGDLGTHARNLQQPGGQRQGCLEPWWSWRSFVSMWAMSACHSKAAQLELLRAHPFVERKLREVPFFFQDIFWTQQKAWCSISPLIGGWWVHILLVKCALFVNLAKGSLVVSVGVWVNRKYHNWAVSRKTVVVYWRERLRYLR